MKFNQLSVGDKFLHNGMEYEKIPEIRLSCCKVKENCRILSDGRTTVLKPLDEVSKIEADNVN